MRLLVGTNQAVELHRLTDDQGDAIRSANVTAKVLGPNGNELPGGSIEIPMTHVADGKYSASIPAAANIQPRQRYILQVEAVWKGVSRVWRNHLIAEYGEFE